MSRKLGMLAGMVILMTACLQTRAELRKEAASGGEIIIQRLPADKPVIAQQQKAAQESSKFDDINKDFRDLYGRVETVENKMAQLQDNEQVKALEMKLAQMENKIQLLESTVTELNNKNKKDMAMLSSDQRAAMNNPAPEKGAFAEASKAFDGKKWEDAILSYEDYRKNNPTGKGYAEATYKIGLCFQNLGMKDDAKVFFKEVVEKFPKSKEASLAKAKLKKI